MPPVLNLPSPLSFSAHSPTFPSLQLRHSSFSYPSIALPTSQLVLQPFRCFTYVTAHSPTLFSLLLSHRLFTYVTWRAAHGTGRPGFDSGWWRDWYFSSVVRVQICPWVHSTSYKISSGVMLASVALDTLLFVVPWLRICGPFYPHHVWAFISCFVSRPTCTFTLYVSSKIMIIRLGRRRSLTLDVVGTSSTSLNKTNYLANLLIVF